MEKSDDSEEDEVQVDQPKEKDTSLPDKMAKDKKTGQASQRNEDFEIVPALSTDTSDTSSSNESDDEDVETKAEILACAQKMLRKKQREQILDDVYNKYMFDDEGLLQWFLDEERRHLQPI